jgi:hypothetical protein
VGLTDVQIIICKTSLRPVATYGAASWTVNEDIATRLTGFERNVLKRRMSDRIEVN